MTDRWAELSHGVQHRGRAHPSLESPFELLEYTTHLQIEYRQKFGEVSYLDIFRGDWRNWLVVSAVSPFEAAMIRGVTEIDDDPSTPLGTLVVAFGPVPFPNITHLTVGAIFGGQDAVWDVAADFRLAPFGHRKTRIDPEVIVWDVLADSKRKMEEMWRRTPLQEYCQRGNAGPLSLPPGVHWTSRPLIPSLPPPIFNFHFHVGMQSSEIPMGCPLPCRWLQDVLDPTRPPHSVLPVFRKALKMNYNLRHAAWTDPERNIHIDLDYHLDIFANPSDFHTPYYAAADSGMVKKPHTAALKKAFDEKQRAEAARLQKTLHKDVPAQHFLKRVAKDVIVWKPAVDFPHCAACGWNYGERLGKGC